MRKLFAGVLVVANIYLLVQIASYMTLPRISERTFLFMEEAAAYLDDAEYPPEVISFMDEHWRQETYLRGATYITHKSFDTSAGIRAMVIEGVGEDSGGIRRLKLTVCFESRPPFFGPTSDWLQVSLADNGPSIFTDPVGWHVVMQESYYEALGNGKKVFVLNTRHNDSAEGVYSYSFDVRRNFVVGKTFCRTVVQQGRATLIVQVPASQEDAALLQVAAAYRQALIPGLRKTAPKWTQTSFGFRIQRAQAAIEY